MKYISTESVSNIIPTDIHAYTHAFTHLYNSNGYVPITLTGQTGTVYKGDIRPGYRIGRFKAANGNEV